MGWYMLPKPGQKGHDGKEIGPCVDGKCRHLDCAAIRQQSETACVHCGKPIGYGTAMCFLPDNKLAHADCEMKAAEKEVRP